MSATEQLHVRLTKDETKIARAVAKAHGLTLSSLIRMWIHREGKKLQKGDGKR